MGNPDEAVRQQGSRDGWKRRRQTSGRSPQPALLVLLLKKRAGFRYRSSIRFARGLRINPVEVRRQPVGRPPGATVNFSKRGTRATIGLPGSGLS